MSTQLQILYWTDLILAPVGLFGPYLNALQGAIVGSPGWWMLDKDEVELIACKYLWAPERSIPIEQRFLLDICCTRYYLTLRIIGVDAAHSICIGYSLRNRFNATRRNP